MIRTEIRYFLSTIQKYQKYQTKHAKTHGFPWVFRFFTATNRLPAATAYRNEVRSGLFHLAIGSNSGIESMTCCRCIAFFSSGVTAVRGTDVRMPHRLDDQLGSYVIIQQDACVGLPDLVRGTTGDPDRITGVIQRGLIGSFMTPAALSALTLTGSVLILATGINLIWDKDIKVVNLTPAIIVAVILSSLIS